MLKRFPCLTVLTVFICARIAVGELSKPKDIDLLGEQTQENFKDLEGLRWKDEDNESRDILDSTGGLSLEHGSGEEAKAGEIQEAHEKIGEGIHSSLATLHAPNSKGHRFKSLRTNDGTGVSVLFENVALCCENASRLASKALKRAPDVYEIKEPGMKKLEPVQGERLLSIENSFAPDKNDYRKTMKQLESLEQLSSARIPKKDLDEQTIMQILKHCLHISFEVPYVSKESYEQPWAEKLQTLVFQVISHMYESGVINWEEMTNFFMDNETIKIVGTHIASVFPQPKECFMSHGTFRPDLDYITSSKHTEHLNHCLTDLPKGTQKLIIHSALTRSYEIFQNAVNWKPKMEGLDNISDFITKEDFLGNLSKWNPRNRNQDDGNDGIYCIRSLIEILKSSANCLGTVLKSNLHATKLEDGKDEIIPTHIRELIENFIPPDLKRDHYLVNKIHIEEYLTNFHMLRYIVTNLGPNQRLNVFFPDQNQYKKFEAQFEFISNAMSLKDEIELWKRYNQFLDETKLTDNYQWEKEKRKIEMSICEKNMKFIEFYERNLMYYDKEKSVLKATADNFENLIWNYEYKRLQYKYKPKKHIPNSNKARIGTNIRNGIDPILSRR